MRLMLNTNAIITAGGLIKNGTGNNSGSKFLYYTGPDGIDYRAFLNQDGEPYINADKIDSIPGVLREFIIRASDVEHFGLLDSPDRRAGEYQYKSAVAILKRTQGSHRYFLEVSATHPEDMVALKSLIFAGKLWPKVDYDAEQVPPPLRQIGVLFRELWQIVCRDISNKLYGIKIHFGN